MPLANVFRKIPLVVLTALLVITGCSRAVRDLTGPVSGAPVDLELDPQARVIGDEVSNPVLSEPLYPLAVGDRWNYAHTTTVTIVSSNGATDVCTTHGVSIRELQCEQPAAGRMYTQEFQVDSTFGGGFISDWVFYRQDASGLFEAYSVEGLAVCGESGPAQMRIRGEFGDRPGDPRLLIRFPCLLGENAEPAVEREFVRQQRLQQSVRVVLGFLPGGVRRGTPPTESRAGEIQRLRYPMRVGQRWMIQSSPLYTARVVSRQQLRTTAGAVLAYRIRIEGELLGPEDQVFAWYGPVGYIGMIERTRSGAFEFLGENGTVMTIDFREVLSGYELQATVARN